MGYNYTPSNSEEFIIRQMKVRDMNDLLDAGFEYKYVLEQALGYRLRKIIGLVPRSIGIVTYNLKIKKVIGFLSLVKHTASIYSIKFVFIAPDFRKKGLATKLLNYTCAFARNSGAKKIFLNPNYNDPALIEFYIKRKFSLIVDNSMLWVNGSPTEFSSEIDKGSNLKKIQSKKDKIKYFNLYKKIMGQNWVDFFGLTPINWVRGFTQDFNFYFVKQAFVDDTEQVLILVSKFPFLSNGFVELYAVSDSAIKEIMDSLSKILIKMSIKHVKISAFNLAENEFYDFLREREFQPYIAGILGQ